MSRGCLTAGHRILTKDLQWVPVEDLVPGDIVVGFDEDPPVPDNKKIKRKWHNAEVLANDPLEASVCDVILSDGSKLTCTWDHPFLVRNGSGALSWRTPEQMHKFLYRKDGERRIDSSLLFERMFPVWDHDKSWEAGYLAGFFDGEGTFSYKLRKRRDRRGVKEFAQQLSVYQKPNAALDTAIRCLDIIGDRHKHCGWYSNTVHDKRNGCRNVTINGGRQGRLAFLGAIRPMRLVEKADWDRMGGLFYYKEDKKLHVIDIVDAGKQTVWGLSTSTKTYVSDGFLSHNTPYHVGKLDDYEDLLAEHLGAAIKDHPFFTIGGVTFDMKHKVGSSSVPYSRGTSIARDRLWNVLWSERGEQPKAGVILRSHVHYFSYVGGPGWVAMTTPALQAAGTKYGGRACSGTVDWGVVVFEVEDGEFDWTAHLVNLESNVVEAVKL